MGQPTPDELSIPATAIRPTRKEKAELVEALNHSTGAVFLLEQFEDRPDGALHFLVGIENDLVAVKYQTNWQWETQLTFLRSVEFSAVEARANDVQFCQQADDHEGDERGGLSRPIPKADRANVQFELTVPTFEDKLAQRAIVMVLEAVYEQDFRPGRSAHQALQSLHTAIMSQGLRWVVDIDIVKYFDSIPHSHLRDLLDQRVTDGVIRRMIDKWLKAGVLEEGLLRHATEGSPQGGVISPCLSNIFLHHVLDEWFEFEVRPRLTGRCILIRFADDAVLAFEDFLDAKRVLGVLGKRFARYGLSLHPDKTRFVDFRNNRPNGTDHPETNGTSFTFLGFTHIWGKSRAGKNVVRQVTAKNRYARALAAVTDWCRRNRHQPIPDQSAHLTAMMRGHYAYYGISGNFRRISWYAYQVVRIWQKWLSRRDRGRRLLWNQFTALRKRHPLPAARIVHRYTFASETLP